MSVYANRTDAISKSIDYTDRNASSTSKNFTKGKKNSSKASKTEGNLHTQFKHNSKNTQNHHLILLGISSKHQSKLFETEKN